MTDTEDETCLCCEGCGYHEEHDAECAEESDELIDGTWPCNNCNGDGVITEDE